MSLSPTRERKNAVSAVGPRGGVVPQLHNVAACHSKRTTCPEVAYLINACSQPPCQGMLTSGEHMTPFGGQYSSSYHQARTGVVTSAATSKSSSGAPQHSDSIVFISQSCPVLNRFALCAVSITLTLMSLRQRICKGDSIFQRHTKNMWTR